MIISVEQAKQLVDLDGWTDEKIEMKLKAIEQTIRAYTNNNFQNRGYRVTADIAGDIFVTDKAPFKEGDTVQVSHSALNAGLYTIVAVDDTAFETVETVAEENGVLVTRIDYPADVVACCINLLEWEAKFRDKVGIKSETLSRHSVTYFNMDESATGGTSNIMGYPASLLGCLKAYKKARF